MLPWLAHSIRVDLSAFSDFEVIEPSAQQLTRLAFSRSAEKRPYSESLRDARALGHATCAKIGEDKGMRSVRDWLAWYVANAPGLSPDRYAYRSPEDFVLQHGEFHSPQPLPSRYALGFPKACYDNSGKLAMTSDLAYVEGFALPKGCPQPIHHAWCITDEQCVIDVTWSEPADQYFGVVLPLAVVLASMRAKKQGKGVLDDWPNDHPTLKTPFTLGGRTRHHF